MSAEQNYIVAAEYAAYGIPNATLEQVSQASNIVDAYLSRPEGLLYSVDADGAPLCMTRGVAESTRTTMSVILSAGASIQISVTGGPILSAGTSIVLNRGQANAEICKISAVSGLTLTLASVAHAHAIGETAETGLAVEESTKLAKNRNYVVLRRNPIVRLVSIQGRITYSRRGDFEQSASMQNFSMVAAMSAFGGAPAWQDIRIPDSNVDVQSGNIWCPIGIAMVPYNEVKLSYIAGYTQSHLPPAVKQATANILRATAESPASASIKTFKAGDTQMERFLTTIIDEDTRQLLAPYESRRYG